MRKYFNKDLSIFEMDCRIFIVWLYRTLASFFAKLINFFENNFGIRPYLSQLFGAWFAVKSIESLVLLCESEEDVEKTMKQHRLELDLLRAKLSELRGY